MRNFDYQKVLKAGLTTFFMVDAVCGCKRSWQIARVKFYSILFIYRQKKRDTRAKTILSAESELTFFDDKRIGIGQRALSAQNFEKKKKC